MKKMCIFAKENFKLILIMAAIKFGEFVDLLSDGDSVYSPIFGYGIVRSLIFLDELKICVESGNMLYFFRTDGSYEEKGKRMLFLNENEFVNSINNN